MSGSDKVIRKMKPAEIPASVRAGSSTVPEAASVDYNSQFAPEYEENTQFQTGGDGSFQNFASDDGAPAKKGGGGRRRDPVRNTDLTSTVIQKQDMNPQTALELQSLRDADQERAIQTGHSMMEQGRIREDIYGQLADRSAEMPNMMMQIMEDGNRLWSQHERKAADLIDRYGNASVNHRRIFSESNSASNFGAALSVALGQIVSIQTGAPNAALGIIDSAIRRDVAEQEFNIATLGKAAYAENSMMNSVIGHTNSQRASLELYANLTKASMMDKLMSKLSVEAATVQRNEALSAASQARQAALMAIDKISRDTRVSNTTAHVREQTSKVDNAFRQAKTSMEPTRQEEAGNVSRPANLVSVGPDGQLILNDPGAFAQQPKSEAAQAAAPTTPELVQMPEDAPKKQAKLTTPKPASRRTRRGGKASRGRAALRKGIDAKKAEEASKGYTTVVPGNRSTTYSNGSPIIRLDAPGNKPAASSEARLAALKAKAQSGGKLTPAEKAEARVLQSGGTSNSPTPAVTTTTPAGPRDPSRGVYSTEREWKRDNKADYESRQYRTGDTSSIFSYRNLVFAPDSTGRLSINSPTLTVLQRPKEARAVAKLMWTEHGGNGRGHWIPLMAPQSGLRKASGQIGKGDEAFEKAVAYKSLRKSMFNMRLGLSDIRKLAKSNPEAAGFIASMRSASSEGYVASLTAKLEGLKGSARGRTQEVIDAAMRVRSSVGRASKQIIEIGKIGGNNVSESEYGRFVSTSGVVPTEEQVKTIDASHALVMERMWFSKDGQLRKAIESDSYNGLLRPRGKESDMVMLKRGGN